MTGIKEIEEKENEFVFRQREIIDKFEEEIREKVRILKEEEEKTFFLREQNEKLSSRLETLLVEIENMKRINEEEIERVMSENEKVNLKELFKFSLEKLRAENNELQDEKKTLIEKTLKVKNILSLFRIVKEFINSTKKKLRTKLCLL